MASRLEWRAGFGAGPVVLCGVGGLAAWVASGWVAWVGWGLLLGSAAYMVFRYRRWNGSPWRRVHFRAMLAYQDIVERGRSRERDGGPAFDVGDACTDLGLLLCGDDRDAVQGMVAHLARTQGGYLAGLAERHAAEVLPGAPFELRREVVLGLRQLPFGPHLVIASVIENIEGGPEAARYALAVLSGDAA